MHDRAVKSDRRVVGYVVREGQVEKKGRYMGKNVGVGADWRKRQRDAWRTRVFLASAKDNATLHGGRVVAIVRRKAREARSQLAELHAIAAKFIPQPPSPERAAAFKARSDETVARIGAKEALRRVIDGCKPERASDEEIAAASALWVEWDGERDVHRKAVLQMRLAEHVATLLTHIEATS